MIRFSRITGEFKENEIRASKTCLRFWATSNNFQRSVSRTVWPNRISVQNILNFVLQTVSSKRPKIVSNRDFWFPQNSRRSLESQLGWSAMHPNVGSNARMAITKSRIQTVWHYSPPITNTQSSPGALPSSSDWRYRTGARATVWVTGEREPYKCKTHN